jgi:hypothetical protein
LPIGDRSTPSARRVPCVRAVGRSSAGGRSCRPGRDAIAVFAALRRDAQAAVVTPRTARESRRRSCDPWHEPGSSSSTMTTDAIVVMLFVELGIFVIGIGSLLVQRWFERGRVSETVTVAHGEKRELVLSRLGA